MSSARTRCSCGASARCVGENVLAMESLRVGAGPVIYRGSWHVGRCSLGSTGVTQMSIDEHTCSLGWCSDPPI